MGTMSYCAFENTSNDMVVCLDKIRTMQMEGETANDLNDYERRGLKRLAESARELLEIYDAMQDSWD